MVDGDGCCFDRLIFISSFSFSSSLLGMIIDDIFSIFFVYKFQLASVAGVERTNMSLTF